MLEKEQDTQDAEEEKEISEEPEQEPQEPEQRPQTVVIDPGHSKGGGSRNKNRLDRAL